MKKVIISLFLPFLLVACNSGLSEEESQQGFAAMDVALKTGSAAAQANSSTADTINIDHTYNCVGGGTAIFTGSLETNDAAETQTQVEFAYDVTFNGCNSNNVVIDGEMSYSLGFEGGFEGEEGNSTTIWDYEGDVDFSGEVDGNCVTDMTGRIDTAVEGMTANFSVEYDGTICGNDASGALSQNIGG